MRLRPRRQGARRSRRRATATRSCTSPATRASRASRRSSPTRCPPPTTSRGRPAARRRARRLRELDPRGRLLRRSRRCPTPASLHRPDTFYGLTKTFVEDLASLYWDKFGLESVMLRICSCFEEPRDRRMLWSWLSFADCVRLAEAALTAPRVGFSVIYGTSDNAAARGLERPRRPHRLPPAATAPTASPPRCSRAPSGRTRRRSRRGWSAAASPRPRTRTTDARCALFAALVGRPGAPAETPATRRLDAAARRRRRQPRLGRDARRARRRHRRGRGGDARLGPAADLHDPPRRRGARPPRSRRAATPVDAADADRRAPAAALAPDDARRAGDALRRAARARCARSGTAGGIGPSRLAVMARAVRAEGLPARPQRRRPGGLRLRRLRPRDRRCCTRSRSRRRFRRQGLGTALTRAAAAWAARAGRRRPRPRRRRRQRPGPRAPTPGSA